MLCVIAKIDKSSRARLSWIQSFAASFGIVPRPIYGHITLAEFEDQAQIAGYRGALAGQTAFSVDFPAVDILADQPVVAALAAPQGVLGTVREKLGAAGDWTPHIALLREEQMNLGWVRTAMAQMFQPFTATVESIEFVRETPRGFEILDRIELKGEGA